MAQLDTTRTYDDGEVLVRADLDAFLDDLEAFLNVTKINDDNIQNNGITGSTKLLNGTVTNAKLAADAVTTLKVADQNITTAKIADEAVTIAKLAQAVADKLLPAGSITAYASTTPPTSWLYCNGAAVSRATYADLYAVVGVKFGQGDGSTTFNVPDFRGRFLRGVDDGQGRDSNAGTRTAMNTGGTTGDNIGSVQGYATALPVNTALTTDAAGTHTHTVTDAFDTSGTGPSGVGVNPNNVSSSTSRTTSSDGLHAHTITGGGDLETRPKNANVAYIIKY